MSGVVIPYRSDAQCVRVNKLVVCLCLSVFLLISHPPIHSFKHSKYFLSPFLPDWPPLSLSLSLTFFILYYFPYHCLSTPVFLHTLFHHTLFHQSFSPRQPQFSTVMGICTFDKKSETTCANQPGFVRRSCFIVN